LSLSHAAENCCCELKDNQIVGYSNGKGQVFKQGQMIALIAIEKGQINNLSGDPLATAGGDLIFDLNKIIMGRGSQNCKVRDLLAAYAMINH
jgi:hypothetical protein